MSGPRPLSSSDGQPLGDTVTANVDKLGGEVGANIAAGAKSLDPLRDVASADHDRLKALSGVYDSLLFPNGNRLQAADLEAQLTVGAQAYFSSTLVPLVYEVWRLAQDYGPLRLPAARLLQPAVRKRGRQPRGCGLSRTYSSRPSTVNWYVTLDPDSQSAQQLHLPGGLPPPATVTDPMWLPSTPERLRHQQVDAGSGRRARLSTRTGDSS